MQVKTPQENKEVTQTSYLTENVIKCLLFYKRSDLFRFIPHTDRILNSTSSHKLFALKIKLFMCAGKTNNIYFLSLEFNIFHFNVVYESLLLNFVAALFLIKLYAFPASQACEILNIRRGSILVRNFLTLFIRTGVFVEML